MTFNSGGMPALERAPYAVIRMAQDELEIATNDAEWAAEKDDPESFAKAMSRVYRAISKMNRAAKAIERRDGSYWKHSDSLAAMAAERAAVRDKVRKDA